MWARIKALPLRVKIIAVVVLVGLGGIYKNVFDRPSHSGGSYSSYQEPNASSPDAPEPSAPPSSSPTASTQSTSEDASEVLAKLQSQYDLLSSQNAQCAAQIQQMNPGNFAPPACEAQMQWNTAQIAKLEAEIYRLKTGANVQPIDFALMGSSAPSSGRGAATGNDPIPRYSREGILGQSKYTDSEGNEYQRPNRPFYYKDRASGRIVGTDISEPPDNEHDWEQLTYQPN